MSASCFLSKTCQGNALWICAGEILRYPCPLQSFTRRWFFHIEAQLQESKEFISSAKVCAFYAFCLPSVQMKLHNSRSRTFAVAPQEGLLFSTSKVSHHLCRVWHYLLSGNAQFRVASPRLLIFRESIAGKKPPGSGTYTWVCCLPIIKRVHGSIIINQNQKPVENSEVLEVCSLDVILRLFWWSFQGFFVDSIHIMCFTTFWHGFIVMSLWSTSLWNPAASNLQQSRVLVPVEGIWSQTDVADIDMCIGSLKMWCMHRIHRTKQSMKQS